ncbi:MAG: hypothetical protein J0L61_00350 [Planctomycetes bacterium]|nr:hypothetical protein [Planctomycetota bacterium]
MTRSRLAAVVCRVVLCALGALWAAPTASAQAMLGVLVTGACCRDDGVCVDNQTFALCFQVGGYYAGDGTTCISNVCGPIGACCVNGACDLGESRAHCVNADFGSWFPACGDPQCNPVGACCLPGNQCVEQTQELCFLNGGTFLGSGSTCAEGACNGACCLPNFGGCVELTESECAIAEGEFNGISTFCGGFYCPGACCLDGFCQELVPYDCFVTFGEFIGGPCTKVQCVAPTGACCRFDGSCDDNVDFGLCVEFGGAYGGDGSTCAKTNCGLTGSCCYVFGGGQSFCQSNTFENDCVNFGGTFNGPGSACDKGSCVFGACCVGLACSDGVSFEACDTQGGTFFANTECSEVVCEPTGACCFTQSCQQLTGAQCNSAEGLYKGDGTMCSPALCCRGDFNNDGVIGTPDLVYFLGRFGGTFPPPGSEPADLNADGLVSTPDLTIFLGAFGRTCPY